MRAMEEHSPHAETFEIVIIGGGPAGLSAALILGRCRRRVLMCDGGRPRNAASRSMHGFLTRDGIEPSEFLAIARQQLEAYESVEFRPLEAIDVIRGGGGFEVLLADGARVFCRKLLLATGVVDHIPDVEGLLDLYGRTVFHCPYCDGWEMRDRPLAVLGCGVKGLRLALALTTWSRDLVLCTNGPSELDSEALAKLGRLKIPVREQKLARIEGDSAGQILRVVFENEDTLLRGGLFFTYGQRQHSILPEKLGCRFNESGNVITGAFESTHVQGLYVAGDASHAAQLAIIAAAEGAEAAFSINRSLQAEHAD